MPISKLNMLKDVELFPLQVRQKHPAHITSSGGAPHLRWLCEHMLHLQHRVKIPDLFPVQQLNSLNLISLIRLPQKKKNHLELFPQLSTMHLEQEEDGMNL